MSAATSACGQDAVSPGIATPQLGITKAGNIYLRTLLVECASFAPWSVVVATPLCPLAVPAVDTFDPAGCVLCTTVVVTGRETVPPATLCPCRARFVAAERREAADVVETEDNPEIKPASAAACPKAPGGTALRVKTSREPNTSFVLPIAIPLQLLHVRGISTQASLTPPRICGLKVHSRKTS